MTKEKQPRFELKGIDEFFNTQEMRDEEKLAKIHEINVNQIDQFPKHPYKVKDDWDMLNLIESIKENGVMTPAIIRKKDNGRYEMISGHRRLHACRLLGMETIRCEIRELTRDEATVFMVDSNLHRSEILPSEKAFAYKMRLDAMKRQGKQMETLVMPMLDSTEDIEGAPVGHKATGKKSRDILAAQVGESREQIRRYIRLTELIPEILRMVDDGIIAMRPAVEISYLPKNLQEELADAMASEACTPTHAQTLRMRKLLKDNMLTKESIFTIMREEKPNQKDRITISDTKAKRYLPKNLPVSEREDFILKAIEHYSKYLERQNERDIR